MKLDLEQNNTAEKDLLFWIKEYLSYKALKFFQNSKSNKIDDIVVSVDLIKAASDIDALKKSVNLMVRDGLGSMSRVANATHQLHAYSIGKLDSIKSIDTNFLQDFKEWLKIGVATKKGYVDAILELRSFIERSNSNKFVFDIDESIVRVHKSSVQAKTIDVMDDEEFEGFSKGILKFKYKNEYEKSRNILICRIFLFSGITTAELLTLSVGTSFLVGNGKMLIRLENRKRDIDLPRRLLIPYYNKYKKLALKEKKYDVLSSPLVNITKQYVNSIVKELLEFVGINRTPLTPQLLRYSFFTYVYNKRSKDYEITFSTIHDISGITNKKELERILNIFDKESVSIAKIFDKEKF